MYNYSYLSMKKQIMNKVLTKVMVYEKLLYSLKKH